MVRLSVSSKVQYHRGIFVKIETISLKEKAWSTTKSQKLIREFVQQTFSSQIYLHLSNLLRHKTHVAMHLRVDLLQNPLFLFSSSKMDSFQVTRYMGQGSIFFLFFLFFQSGIFNFSVCYLQNQKRPIKHCTSIEGVSGATWKFALGLRKNIVACHRPLGVQNCCSLFSLHETSLHPLDITCLTSISGGLSTSYSPCHQCTSLVLCSMACQNDQDT